MTNKGCCCNYKSSEWRIVNHFWSFKVNSISENKDKNISHSNTACCLYQRKRITCIIFILLAINVVKRGFNKYYYILLYRVLGLSFEMDRLYDVLPRTFRDKKCSCVPSGKSTTIVGISNLKCLFVVQACRFFVLVASVADAVPARNYNFLFSSGQLFFAMLWRVVIVWQKNPTWPEYSTKVHHMMANTSILFIPNLIDMCICLVCLFYFLGNIQFPTFLNSSNIVISM